MCTHTCTVLYYDKNISIPPDMEPSTLVLVLKYNKYTYSIRVLVLVLKYNKYTYMSTLVHVLVLKYNKYTYMSTCT